MQLGQEGDEALLYGRCVKRIGAKSAYIALMLFSFVCNTGLPFIINKPEQAAYTYFFAPIAGMYFGLFYAMQSAVFTNFIPVGEEAACYGLQNFSGVVIRWIPPLIYTMMDDAGASTRSGSRKAKRRRDGSAWDEHPSDTQESAAVLRQEDLSKLIVPTHRGELESRSHLV